MGKPKRLDRTFFERATEEVAAELIGCTLSTLKDGQLTSGRIVETEAYGGADDLASHASIYRRARSGIMSGRCGVAYVYRIYGVHACFNVVAHEPDLTGAVLIRALEPLNGLDVMRERRRAHHLRMLCGGPGRLAQALAIHLEDSHRDVVADDSIQFVVGEQPERVVSTTRIGITRATDRLWRFCDADSAFLSKPLNGRPASRAADASMAS